MVSYDQKNSFEYQRSNMVKTHLKARDITNPGVLDAMAEVPREEFIPEKYTQQAYVDSPVPIGLGQTISQPYIVALMTQCLCVDKSHAVLEIGTGSGYQTAILAKLAGEVYTIERLGQLSEPAQSALGRLGIANVRFCIGDGSLGWPQTRENDEKIIFDRIIVTAAIPKIPIALTDQLAEGGVLVAPVGGEFSQNLIVYEKRQNQLHEKFVCGCRFVKLIGEYGFDE